MLHTFNNSFGLTNRVEIKTRQHVFEETVAQLLWRNHNHLAYHSTPGPEYTVNKSPNSLLFKFESGDRH